MGQVELMQISRAGKTGTVDHQLRRTILLHMRRQQRRHLLGLYDIEGLGQHGLGGVHPQGLELLTGEIELGGRPGIQQHVRAHPHQLRGNGFANALGSTGDKRQFIGIEAHRSSMALYCSTAQ
jgi:hypothetical protein